MRCFPVDASHSATVPPYNDARPPLPLWPSRYDTRSPSSRAAVVTAAAAVDRIVDRIADRIEDRGDENAVRPCSFPPLSDVAVLREVRRVMRRAATGRGASTGNGLLVAPVMAPGCGDPVGEFPDDALVHVVGGADTGAA